MYLGVTGTCYMDSRPNPSVGVWGQIKSLQVIGAGGLKGSKFEVVYQGTLLLVPDQHVHFFYARSHFRASKMGMKISQPILELFLKLNIPVHNLLGCSSSR